MSIFGKRKDGTVGNIDPDDQGKEFDPDAFKEELATSFKSQLEESNKAFGEKLKPMEELALLMKEERANREKAEREASEKKKREESQETDIDFLLDPDKAVDAKLAPAHKAIHLLAAKQVQGEILPELPFYHGDIKSKVNALIATLPLAQQSNPASIMNCYKITVFDHDTDIKDGKIKAKNSAINFNGNSTGGPSGSDKSEATESLSADEKLVAKQFGMTEKEWVASRKELSFV